MEWTGWEYIPAKELALSPAPDLSPNRLPNMLQSQPKAGMVSVAVSIRINNNNNAFLNFVFLDLRIS